MIVVKPTWNWPVQPKIGKSKIQSPNLFHFASFRFLVVSSSGRQKPNFLLLCYSSEFQPEVCFNLIATGFGFEVSLKVCLNFCGSLICVIYIEHNVLLWKKNVWILMPIERSRRPIISFRWGWGSSGHKPWFIFYFFNFFRQ